MSKTLFSAEELTHPTTSGEIVRPRPNEALEGLALCGAPIDHFGALRAYFRRSSRAPLGRSFSVRPASIPFLNKSDTGKKVSWNLVTLHPLLLPLCTCQEAKVKGWPFFHSWLSLRNGNFFVPQNRSPLKPFHAVYKMLNNNSMYVLTSSLRYHEAVTARSTDKP